MFTNYVCHFPDHQYAGCLGSHYDRFGEQCRGSGADTRVRGHRIRGEDDVLAVEQVQDKCER